MVKSIAPAVRSSVATIFLCAPVLAFAHANGEVHLHTLSRMEQLAATAALALGAICMGTVLVSGIVAVLRRLLASSRAAR